MIILRFDSMNNVGKIVLLTSLLPIIGIEYILPSGIIGGDLIEQWNYVAIASLISLIAFIFYFYFSGKEDCFHFLGNVIIWGIIISISIEAIWGLLQLYGYLPSFHSVFKVTGTFFNPAPYSGYLALGGPLCLNELLVLRREKNKSFLKLYSYCFLIFVLLLIVVVLPCGMSRSAWISTIFSSLFVLEMHYSFYSSLKNVWLKGPNKVFCLILVALILLLCIGGYLFFLKKDSALGRLFMWKIECRAIAQKPLLGYGANSFAHTYEITQEDYFSSELFSEEEEFVAGVVKYAFNEYFQMAIEYGLPVLFLYIGFCVYGVYIGIKNKRYGICGGIISFMIFSFSSYPLHLPVLFSSFLLLLLAAIAKHDKAFLWLYVFLFSSLVFLNYKPYESEAYNHWRRSEIYWVNDGRQALIEYEKLYPLLGNNASFLFKYGFCLYRNKRYEEAIECLKEAELLSCDPMILNVIGRCYQLQHKYEEAEYWYIRSTHFLPNRIYPYYLLAKLYAEPDYYNSTELNRMKDIVLFKEPKVYSKAIEEMREEIQRLK